MKHYSQMKDSGIEWIGEIPEEWNVKPLQYIVKKIISGPFGSSLKKESYVSKGYKIYGQEQVISEDLSFGDYYISQEKFDQLRRFSVNPDDLLISCVGTFGKIALVPKQIQEGIINPRLIKISPSEEQIFPKFLYQYLKSKIVFLQLDKFSRGGTMDIINSFILSKILVFVPKIKEQKQIVSYLDKKTAKIDNEITKNQNLIKLLQEKRQSEINRAVTKGLDDAVPMKDSGIEWIGEIPEEWNLNKIKFTSYVKGRIGYHGLRSDEFIDDGPYLITGTDFTAGRINWNVCYHVPEWRYEQDPLIKIKNNDVLITKDGTVGKVAFIENLPGKTTLNSHLLVLRPLKDYYDPRLLYWIFLGDYFKNYFNLVQSGSIMNSLSQEKVENFIFVLPSKTEQKQIASYLDKKTTKIDSLISKIQLQISKLQEFRESLISSAVTGKIQVAQA